MQRASKSKKWLIISIAAVLVIVLAVALLSGAGSANRTTPALMATAETGAITSTVVGSGSLEYGENLNILLPLDLKVNKVHVAAGDYVEPGDVLATFEPASVQTQIEALEDELESIDADINGKKGSTVSSYVYANVSGRVKALYAESGLETADVVADNGALMVLSIDGKMAVDIVAPEELEVGDTVTVVLPDESTKTGTIEKIKNGVCTVTLTDNGPELGATVKIKHNDAEIGSGTLYIHQPITVLGTTGKIKTVHVSLNSWVGKGNTLVTLEDVSFSAAYQELLAQHEQVAAALANLVTISRTNSLIATTSGVVQSVNIKDGSKTSQSSGSTGQSGSDSSADLSAYGMSAGAENGNAVTQLGAARTANTANTASVQLLAAGGAPVDIDDTMVQTGLAALTPVTGGTPLASVTGTEFNGIVTWMTTDVIFMPKTVYNGHVTLTANTGYRFSANYVPDLGPDVTVSKVTYTNGSALNGYDMIEFDAAYPETADMGQGGFPGGTGGFGGFGGYDLSGLTGDSGSAGTGLSGASSGADTASDFQMTALTVASGEQMTLVIEIDQLDIGAVQKGQKASVTFDAITGKTFQGVITKIADSAASGSGVARYKVSISLPRDDAMRAAMNATATITVSERADALCIPADAVQEVGGRVFVYIKSDDKGNLSGEVEVVTGLSDGINVEIVSGLKAGDVVYYKIAVAQSSMFFGGPMMTGGGSGDPQGVRNGG